MAQEWTEGFQRKVLAGGAAGVIRLQAGTWIKLFASEVPGTPAGPRERVARCLDQFFAEDTGEAPGLDTLEELLRRDTARLSLEEQQAIAREWAVIRATSVPDPTFVEKELVIWLRRQSLVRAMVRAADLLDRPDAASLGQAETIVQEALTDGSLASTSGLAVVRTLPSRLAAWEQDDMTDRIPTGLPKLDRVLGGGPRRGESMYFIAPPKGGKSSALINVALNAVRRRFGVAFVSYEMRETPMTRRFDRNIARASRMELRLNPDLLEKAGRGLISAGAGELWLRCETPQQRSAVGEVERWVDILRREGEQIDLVILDYLNIMGASGEEREKRHELARASREISALGKNLDVVVWSAALVKRDAVRRKIIRKDDIAEAFEVIAVCDGAVAICGDEEMIRAKQRLLYACALREEEDEREAGTYYLDQDRMQFLSAADWPLSSPKNITPGVEGKIG